MTDGASDLPRAEKENGRGALATGRQTAPRAENYFR
jgi:hypothetical protein